MNFHPNGAKAAPFYLGIMYDDAGEDGFIFRVARKLRLAVWMFVRYCLNTQTLNASLKQITHDTEPED